MFFRLLIAGLLVYWTIKLVRNLFSTGKTNVEIVGKAQKDPLDLSEQDVEDVDYKEIKDKK